MDHKQQHHEHHRHEREEYKKKKKQREHVDEKNTLPIHPLWLFVVGVVLMIAAMLVYMFMF